MVLPTFPIRKVGLAQSLRLNVNLSFKYQQTNKNITFKMSVFF